MSKKNKGPFKLITDQFPDLLKQLCNAPKKRVSEYFCRGKGIVNHLARLVDNNSDFQGIYMFYEDSIPIYVGISKHVIERLGQQTKSKSHNKASLAIRILQDRHQEEFENFQRNGFTNEIIARGLDYIQQLEFAFLPISDSNTLYLFEVYAALELDCKYNSFDTH